ncbi:MAG: hypothetical protein JWN18_427 [Parcubacteria group bacterium]|nr:hypothetical protein [Parcubacteria group bacterium]
MFEIQLYQSPPFEEKRMAAQTEIKTTGKPVNIISKLRRASAWIEESSKDLKAAAINRRRKQERTRGEQLDSDKIVTLVDELEEIQRKLNPLENQRASLVEQLLAHWGHTGVEEIEGALGKTLISTSFELAVDPDVIEKNISVPLWRRLSARTLQADLLLTESNRTPKIRDAILSALVINKLKVSVTSPSSRRAKSGETDGESEDE